MPYIIDGHNLIPRIPGLDLASLDDEVQLIEMVQEFCRLRRKRAEVYFDNAPPGQPKARHYGQVLARFVRAGQTADDAIRARLLRLGAEARNWTVVSSDQQIQIAARAARAQSIGSEEFARLLMDTLRQGERAPGNDAEGSLGAGEVQEWLDLFSSGSDRSDES
jgi:predicted RNA-binding protein with PIN domain